MSAECQHANVELQILAVTPSCSGWGLATLALDPWDLTPDELSVRVIAAWALVQCGCSAKLVVPMTAASGATLHPEDPFQSATMQQRIIEPGLRPIVRRDQPSGRCSLHVEAGSWTPGSQDLEQSIRDDAPDAGGQR